MWSKTDVRGRRQRRPAAELHQVADLAQLVEPDEAVDLRDLALAAPAP